MVHLRLVKNLVVHQQLKANESIDVLSTYLFLAVHNSFVVAGFVQKCWVKIPITFGVQNTMDVLFTSGFVCDNADGNKESRDDILVLLLRLPFLVHVRKFSKNFNFCN